MAGQLILRFTGLSPSLALAFLGWEIPLYLYAFVIHYPIAPTMLTIKDVNSSVPRGRLYDLCRFCLGRDNHNALAYGRNDSPRRAENVCRIGHRLGELIACVPCSCLYPSSVSSAEVRRENKRLEFEGGGYNVTAFDCKSLQQLTHCGL